MEPLEKSFKEYQAEIIAEFSLLNSALNKLLDTLDAVNRTQEEILKKLS